jgi:hypothetical protein
MWRVIVRISYTSDTGSVLRNHVVQFFNALGLHNTATGTFESAAVPRNQAATQLANVLNAVADPLQVPNSDPQVTLKHLWVYIDRV